MEPLQRRIGSRIRTLRNQQDITLEQLAEKSGLPSETISRIERGRAAPSIRSLDRLAIGLGLSLADLVGDGPVVQAGGVPAEVRGIALMLAGASGPVLSKARRILQVLLEGDGPGTKLPMATPKRKAVQSKAKTAKTKRNPKAV